MLCKLRDLIKTAADTYAEYHRRAGVRPGELHGLDDEVLDALRAVRRLEHLEAAHVLAAKALGSNGELYFVPRYKVNGYECGGVVLGVHTAQRVGDHALAQIALHVAVGNTRVYRTVQVARYVYVLPNLKEHAGHASVLADRKSALFCRAHITAQHVERVLGHRPGFGTLRLTQCAADIVGQAQVRLPAQAADLAADDLR